MISLVAVLLTLVIASAQIITRKQLNNVHPDHVPLMHDGEKNRHITSSVNILSKDWSFFYPFSATFIGHITDWQNNLMDELYGIYKREGDSTFKVFNNWINPGFCGEVHLGRNRNVRVNTVNYQYIDAKIEFKKAAFLPQKLGACNVDIIYTFVGITLITNNALIERIVARGYHLEPITDSQFKEIKNPDYASQPYVQIGKNPEQVALLTSLTDNAQDVNGEIWNGKARFQELKHMSCTRSVEDQKLSVAIGEIAKITKTAIQVALGDVFGLVDILGSVENWVWSFEWKAAIDEKKTMTYHQVGNTYYWFIAFYKKEDFGCSCCLGGVGRTELGVSVDIHVLVPVNREAR
eukprot:235325_1